MNKSWPSLGSLTARSIPPGAGIWPVRGGTALSRGFKGPGVPGAGPRGRGHGGERAPPAAHPQDALPDQPAGEGKQGPEGRAAGLRAQGCAGPGRWGQHGREPRLCRGDTGRAPGSPAGQRCSAPGEDRYRSGPGRLALRLSVCPGLSGAPWHGAGRLSVSLSVCPELSAAPWHCPCRMCQPGRAILPAGNGAEPLPAWLTPCERPGLILCSHQSHRRSTSCSGGFSGCFPTS